MTPSSDTRCITLLIQKHIVLLGTDAALSRARSIQGLTVAENGDVLRTTRDPKRIYAELEHAYATFAGSASKIIARMLKNELLIA